MNRPARLVFVTGTGTDVGKTWMGAAALATLRTRGVRVAARKPAQSFVPGGGASDADVLASATGELSAVVCLEHRSYPVALAPPMAAEALDAPPFTIADLAAELDWPRGIELGVVEGAGGVRSPLAADGDNLDLLGELEPDAIVLVADAGLGTINSVRLAVTALTGWRPIVVLNRFDPVDELHRRNLEWLGGVDGFDVVTGPDALADRLVADAAGPAGG
jgi:dethiobiotin synthetase